MNLTVRDFVPSDAQALRTCVVALQEEERRFDPQLPSGEAIAEAYIAQLHESCRRSAGSILIAEVDGAIAGFAAVMTRERFTEPDDPVGTYALITDLVVLEAFRRRGAGRSLLDRALAMADAAGTSEVRVVVLARNDGARALYRRGGFEPYLEVYSRRRP